MRLFVSALVLVLLATILVAAQNSRTKKKKELYRVDNETSIIAAARTLMTSDKNAALITVDADGVPRARTVLTHLGPADGSSPDKGMTVWIMTRRSTRKVEQISNNPNVTLYFNDDPKNSYVTLMGIATIHLDPNDKEAKKFTTMNMQNSFGLTFKKTSS